LPNPFLQGWRFDRKLPASRAKLPSVQTTITNNRRWRSAASTLLLPHNCPTAGTQSLRCRMEDVFIQDKRHPPGDCGWTSRQPQLDMWSVTLPRSRHETLCFWRTRSVPAENHETMAPQIAGQNTTAAVGGDSTTRCRCRPIQQIMSTRNACLPFTTLPAKLSCQ
jgi:hypothetical protein